VPHIRLMTSANLPENEQADAILRRLVEVLSGIETIDPAAIKAYHAKYETWAMGEGACPGFIHCEIALLTGRSTALRQIMGAAFEKTLQELFVGSISNGLAVVNVEVRELDIDTYRR
jgi:5-carboxymethyl-2-hydroxymuconate isomerase